jgi:hypothetical protein
MLANTPAYFDGVCENYKIDAKWKCYKLFFFVTDAIN